MGLNQIPTGILIRARLLKLKAGGIPGFIIKRSEERVSGQQLLEDHCQNRLSRSQDKIVQVATELDKLPPDRIIQVVTSQNWTTGHIYATMG